MRRVDLEQQSSQWHDWRRQGIGGSDIPTIMGISPYPDSTRESLLIEKATGKRRKTNFAMGKGQRLEPIALRQFCDWSGNLYAPVCVEHLDEPWVHASLDGYCPDNHTFCEIKYARSIYHHMALMGLVPKHVMVQMQWQFFATNCERGWLVSVNDGTKEFRQPEQYMAVVEVLPNASTIAAILTEAKRFWAEVQTYGNRLDQDRDDAAVEAGSDEVGDYSGHY